jgi:hypothetical protein
MMIDKVAIKNEGVEVVVSKMKDTTLDNATKVATMEIIVKGKEKGNCEGVHVPWSINEEEYPQPMVNQHRIIYEDHANGGDE